MIPTIPFYFTPSSPPQLQSPIQGNGVDLPASIHAPGQRASPEHSHLSHTPARHLSAASYCLQGKAQIPWDDRQSPRVLALSCLSRIISCYTSPHSPATSISHLRQYYGVDLSLYLTRSPSGSLDLPLSFGPQPETFSPLRFAWLTPTNLKKS